MFLELLFFSSLFCDLLCVLLISYLVYVGRCCSWLAATMGRWGHGLPYERWGGGGSIRRALKVGIARCTGITCCHIGSSRVVMRTGGGCVRGGIQRVFNTSIATYVPIIVVVTFKISEVSFILQHSSSRSFFCDVFVDAYRPWLAPAS